jgi:hypothetical protein
VLLVPIFKFRVDERGHAKLCDSKNAKLGQVKQEREERDVHYQADRKEIKRSGLCLDFKE